MESYGKLCADFYDAEKSLAEPEEVSYFADQIVAARGPALEAMCGAGRLLVPLLRNGLLVEGVDHSPAMLANLETKAKSWGLRPPTTYLQSVTELALPRKYRIIVVALGSIQLLPDVKPALERFRAHLEEGGRLVLDTFVPWDLIDMPEKRHSKRQLKNIHLESETTVDLGSRQYHVLNRYERRDDNTVVEREEERLAIHWYFPEQLLPLIDAAGFTAQSLGIPFMADRPRRHLYTAVAR